MKLAAFFSFVILIFVKANILKLPECGKYDAEFSKITYHQRLLGAILKTLGFISLRKCLTKCMLHPTCQSVNFMRQNETCELLGNSARINSSGNSLFSPANGWNHFETDYDKKTLGSWCSNGNNNPCNVITERCEDRCVGNHQCVAVAQSLHEHVNHSSISTLYGTYYASLAFDGNEDTWACTNNINTGGEPNWIKAVFKSRVFINYVIFVNRQDTVNTVHENRCDNVDLKTILHENNNQNLITTFGNTGDLGNRTTISCMKFADEIIATQNPPHQTMNLAEIWIHGRII